MDGIRAYWDGSHLFSKHGNPLQAPSWFLETFPRVCLDGELWCGRGNFGHLSWSINANCGNWKDITYWVFDLPSLQGTYEMRWSSLKQMNLLDPIHLVSSQKCKDLIHLEEYLTSILEYGGEGVIAREPGALHASGRTSSILKIKVIVFFWIQLTLFQKFQDTEVKLVDVYSKGGLLCQQ